MSVFGIPEGMTLKQALYSLFEHYATKREVAGQEEFVLDALSFSKFIRDCPELDFVSRADIDLIFSKVKKVGDRRINYSEFLASIIELALLLYPDVDPKEAVVQTLAGQILGLFDHHPSDQPDIAVEAIRKGLS
jgi:hypothetical protein